MSDAKVPETYDAAQRGALILQDRKSPLSTHAVSKEESMPEVEEGRTVTGRNPNIIKATTQVTARGFEAE